MLNDTPVSPTPISRRLLLTALAGAGVLVAAGAAAHNNPSFREDLLLSVAVAGAPLGGGGYSESFALSWPKKTVQLIWRVRDTDAGDRDAVRFAVAQQGETVAENLGHEASSGRLEGDGFTIVDVDADGPFTLDIYAKVLDRSQQQKKP